MRVTLRVNRWPHSLELDPMRRLLDVIREDLGLTGVKEGCGEGECGACAVILDGELVNSCLVPVCQASGVEITTVEGLQDVDGALSPLQRRFLECGAAQCGICTPGMLVAGQAFIQKLQADENARFEAAMTDAARVGLPEAQPAEDLALAAREAIAGNLCRCTGYQKIVDALASAAADEGAARHAVTLDRLQGLLGPERK